MFTEKELAHCNKIASLTKSAWSFSGGGASGPNPNRMNISWNSFQDPIKMPAAKPMTMLGSMGTMGKGLAGQAGNYAQMLFTGHHGQPGLLGNIASGISDTFTSGNRFTPKQLWGPGGKVWAPWREAQPELQQAWSQTGAPAEYATNKGMDVYHAVKHWLVDPRNYGRS